MLRRLAVACALFWLLPACSAERGENYDLASRADVREDYRVFAARCSKCHSLARPLNSGIDDDEHWRMYVERMRRQPGSGITLEDTVPILRFLHQYSLEERRKKAERRGDGVESPPPAPSGSAAPDASSGAPSTGVPAPTEPR
jgi:hypothetical protein